MIPRREPTAPPIRPVFDDDPPPPCSRAPPKVRLVRYPILPQTRPVEEIAGTSGPLFLLPPPAREVGVRLYSYLPPPDVTEAPAELRMQLSEHYHRLDGATTRFAAPPSASSHEPARMDRSESDLSETLGEDVRGTNAPEDEEEEPEQQEEAWATAAAAAGPPAPGRLSKAARRRARLRRQHPDAAGREPARCWYIAPPPPRKRPAAGHARWYSLTLPEYAHHRCLWLQWGERAASARVPELADVPSPSPSSIPSPRETSPTRKPGQEGPGRALTAVVLARPLMELRCASPDAPPPHTDPHLPNARAISGAWFATPPSRVNVREWDTEGLERAAPSRRDADEVQEFLFDGEKGPEGAGEAPDREETRLLREAARRRAKQARAEGARDGAAAAAVGDLSDRWSLLQRRRTEAEERSRGGRPKMLPRGYFVPPAPALSRGAAGKPHPTLAAESPGAGVSQPTFTAMLTPREPPARVRSLRLSRTTPCEDRSAPTSAVSAPPLAPSSSSSSSWSVTASGKVATTSWPSSPPPQITPTTPTLSLNASSTARHGPSPLPSASRPASTPLHAPTVAGLGEHSSATFAAELAAFAEEGVQELLSQTSGTVVPLKTLEKALLKRLESYSAAAAAVQSPATRSLAVRWFADAQAGLRVWLRGAGHVVDPSGNVTLSVKKKG